MLIKCSNDRNLNPLLRFPLLFARIGLVSPPDHPVLKVASRVDSLARPFNFRDILLLRAQLM